MARKKKSRKKRVVKKNTRKKPVEARQPPEETTKEAVPELRSPLPDVQKLTEPAALEPTGACRYLDQNGRMTCEDGVTKSYCDAQKNSTFIPHGRCS